MTTFTRKDHSVDANTPRVPDPPGQQLSRLHTAQQANMWALLLVLVAMLAAGMFIWVRP